MGPGIYGAEAASQYWFGHSAKTLSRAEAAQLAAILPNPIKRKAKGSKRSDRIAANARTVVSQGLDACAAE
jgi:monofunctional biosynthetic peptidoglycan transglycosylase